MVNLILWLPSSHSCKLVSSISVELWVRVLMPLSDHGSRWLWSQTRDRSIVGLSPAATEVSPYRGGCYTINLSRFKVLSLMG
ncbi:hypothetical protein TNCV_4527411 [Trichonephila clavipes]|nr:hypothetical protein TNCV_4527411 [Trichonephila clavipes]